MQEYQINLGIFLKSGRVDVVAKKDGEKIAIEIETGKSNYSLCPYWLSPNKATIFNWHIFQSPFIQP
ncbi:MAG: hypothetical protein DRP65_00905 [Planctomycetota bacterium]|nr:MAG: hypothetical protein DRP65_00905 [Planctomycetota bacterium]